MTKQKRKTGLRDVLLTLGMVVSLTIGAAALAYPSLANAYSDWYADRLIAKRTQDKKSQEALAAQMAKRQEEARGEALLDPYSDESLNGLVSDPISIDIYAKHMIGEIFLPAISQYLPVFDVASDQFLARGAAWLASSSKITGGAGTHSVVSGHSGIPKASLFNNIAKLKKGDLIIYKVGDVYEAYQVFQKKTVKPEDSKAIAVKSGEDLTTLVTCTPIGINSHRLLVTGRRVPFTPSMLKTVKNITKETKTKNHLMIAGAAAFVVAMIAVVATTLKSYLKKRSKGRRKGTVANVAKI
ncbi:class C sortase [Pseudolactococcus insecticola]|uniref:Class C sortase n=1 Tax=Pseudolactococcus insecticola TaxID=2709158 RepID=A0A6A0B7D8_9LACT|nr:class C sortase [Lactococcus insecticola]GFH40388.1 class C sortase [Lactococcus insecticola]